MAELEDVTLDGKPLHSLRVADLKAALEQRGLQKSGQKNALVKRLKGALMLENLQKHSTSHAGLQPNSQIGEEMSQNSFIKQYLAKQQELLRQRLEREAREAADSEDVSAESEEETSLLDLSASKPPDLQSIPEVPEQSGINAPSRAVSEMDSPSVQEEESSLEDRSEGYDSGSCPADQEESLTASLPKRRAVPARASPSPQSRRRSGTRAVRQSPAQPQPDELDSENLPGPVPGTAYSPVSELQAAEPARSRRSRHSRDGSFSLDPSSSPVPERTSDGSEQSRPRRSSSRQIKDSVVAPGAVLVVAPLAQQTSPTDLVVRAEAQSPGPRAVASLSVRVIGGSSDSSASEPRVAGSSVLTAGVGGGADWETRGAPLTHVKPQQQGSAEMDKDVVLTEGVGSVRVVVEVGGGEEKAAPKERLRRSRQLREPSPPPPDPPNPVLKCGAESFPLPDTPKQSPPASEEQAPEVGCSQVPQKAKKEREEGGGSSFEATKRRSHQNQEPGPLSRLAKAMEEDDDDDDDDDDEDEEKVINLTLEKRESVPEVVEKPDNLPSATAVGSAQESVLTKASVEKATTKPELPADGAVTLARSKESPEAPRGRPREVLEKEKTGEESKALPGKARDVSKTPDKPTESSGGPQKVVEAQKPPEMLGKPAEVSEPIASEMLGLGQTRRSADRKEAELPEKKKQSPCKSLPAAFRVVRGSPPATVEPKPALEKPKEANPVTGNLPVRVAMAAVAEKTAAEKISSDAKLTETETEELEAAALIDYSSSAPVKRAVRIHKLQEGGPGKTTNQAAGEKTTETEKPKNPEEVFVAKVTDKQEQPIPTTETKEVPRESSKVSEKGTVEKLTGVSAVPENLPLDLKLQTAVPQEDSAMPKEGQKKDAASEEAKAAAESPPKEVLKLDSRLILQPEKGGVGEMAKGSEQTRASQSHLPFSKRGRDLGISDKRQEETREKGEAKTSGTENESSLKPAHPEKQAEGGGSKSPQTLVMEVPTPAQEASKLSENLTAEKQEQGIDKQSSESPAAEPKSMEVTAGASSEKPKETLVSPTPPLVQPLPKKFRVFRDTPPSPEAGAPPKKIRFFRDGPPAPEHPKKSFQTRRSAESIPETKPEMEQGEMEKQASLERPSEAGQLPKESGVVSAVVVPGDAAKAAEMRKEGEAASKTAEGSAADPKKGSESGSLEREGPPLPVETKGWKPEQGSAKEPEKKVEKTQEPENDHPKKAGGVSLEKEKESGPPKRKSRESSPLDKDLPKPAQDEAETSGRQQAHKETLKKQEDKTPAAAAGKRAETANSSTSETPKSPEGRLMKAAREPEKEPMGPILPPSPPPEETESGHPPTPPLSAPDTERERGRRSREEGASPSSPSSSSSSSSNSSSSSSASSSRSSSSSSASSRSRSPSSDRRSMSPQRDSLSRDSGAFCQPEGSPDSGRPDDPPVPRHHERRKRRAEREEEEEEEEEGEREERAGSSHSKKPCLTAEESGDVAGKDERRAEEGGSRTEHRASELKRETSSGMMEPESLEENSKPSDEKGSKGRAEEGAQLKTFTSRKISVLSASKSLSAVSTAEPAGGGAGAAVPGGGAGGGEADVGQAGRKRRWGSSTAVTAKKPSISITTESLKSLIPDMKPVSAGGQEAVLDLHPDEGHLSGEESERPEGRGDPREQDRGLQIRRTVTQVVPAEAQENGQNETSKEGGEEEAGGEEEEAERKEPQSVTMETQPPVTGETDVKKATPGGSLVRRSISQQKSGMSVTIDDPVRSTQHPSPPRGKPTSIVHISNLVRPFTLGQLKELLNRTGTLVEEGFWIDKIKSHCYVTYSTMDQAVATRTALHGVKWPQSNPKFLSVEFSEQDELDFHKGLLPDLRPAEGPRQLKESLLQRSSHPAPPPPSGPPQPRLSDRPVRDQWAEREREMERRERARAEREWDRDKVRDYNSKQPPAGGPGGHRTGAEGPGAAGRRSRSRSRDRRRKERAKSKEKKAERKEKAPEEPPAKLLDDLFCKTKAAPCIYWLPLTPEQVALKDVERAERMKERIKRRKEQEEEEKKREEERMQRLKEREKEVAEKERERVRQLEKRREQRREEEEGER
ncbi:LOW QUALITY PROTEIN: apoptotic chromatin condensation inducer in the nucleus-like, partial [Polyodon spathula]|uniref:LOW QUALITY PROTEIN: apoptotic chromatin condensation inducer in the nucleus-like n=1 Tax=Polyodon spathula TaxID=7913 RepID=UPI001B7E7768